MPIKTNTLVNPDTQARIRQLKLRMDWRAEKPLAWRAHAGRMPFCGMARPAGGKKQKAWTTTSVTSTGEFNNGLIRHSARLPLPNYGPPTRAPVDSILELFRGKQDRRLMPCTLVIVPNLAISINQKTAANNRNQAENDTRSTSRLELGI